MDRDQRRGLRAAVAAYTLWGLLTLYWKELAGLDAFELIGWRVSTAGLIMAVVVTALGLLPGLCRSVAGTSPGWSTRAA